jgi:hypothetical protein
MAVRFRNRYLAVTECAERPKAGAGKKPAASKMAPRPKSQWMKNFHLTPLDKAALSAIPTASGAKLIG